MQGPQKLDAKTKTVAAGRRNPVKIAGHRSWVFDENRNHHGGHSPRTNGFTYCSPIRPRTEKSILRFHLPFTPGIIPKNRNELAETITRAVAGEVN